MNKETEKILNELQGKGVRTSDILKVIVKNNIKEFYELQRWDEEDFNHYDKLMKQLIDVSIDENAKTTDKGKALEDLVSFIIKKTYFFEIYRNITTSTNEIDQIIRLSNRGKQALKNLELSREILEIEEDLFLSECKNYKSNLGVSWVGKFYGLLKTCDCKFGIIFSVNGLTGAEKEWKDAYGLIKVFRLIEKYQYNNDFYIIEFNMDDFKKIREANDPKNFKEDKVKLCFTDIIKFKKEAVRIGTNYEQLLSQYKEDIEEEVVQEVKRLKNGS